MHKIREAQGSVEAFVFMKLDLEFFKTLILAFENAPEPRVDFGYLLKSLAVENKSKLAYHLELAADKGLIAGEGEELGIRYDGYEYQWQAIPLRLTAQGQDFAGAISKNEVWESVKQKAKTESLGVLVSLATSLSVEFAKKQFGM